MAAWKPQKKIQTLFKREWKKCVFTEPNLVKMVWYRKKCMQIPDLHKEIALDFSKIFSSCFILLWAKEAAAVHFTWMLKQLEHTSEHCNTLFAWGTLCSARAEQSKGSLFMACTPPTSAACTAPPAQPQLLHLWGTTPCSLLTCSKFLP